MIQAIKGWANKLRYVAKVIHWLADSLAGFPVPDFSDEKDKGGGENIQGNSK